MAGRAEATVTLTGTEQYGAEGAVAQPQVVPRSKGRMVVNWITSTDNKTIGYLYLITSPEVGCCPGQWTVFLHCQRGQVQAVDLVPQVISMAPARFSTCRTRVARRCSLSTP